MTEISKQQAAEHLHYCDIPTIAARFRAGTLSSVELTTHILNRIDALNGKLNAYILVMRDYALSAAADMDRELAAGKDRGLLHGIPVGIKDLCHIEGYPTTAGMKARKGALSTETATVVKNLEAAGAVVLGKLNTTEGALIGYHRDFDIPVNPWGSEFWPGVSSSGSGVAISAGLCFGAVGTDTGGSIRLPAMANGVVGLKPTYERVSREGVVELAGSLDHIGPLARTTHDCEILIAAMAGESAPSSEQADSSLAGLNIGYDPKFTQLSGSEGIAAAIDASLRVLEERGANIVPVSVPEMPAGFESTWLSLTSVEALAAHTDFYPAREDEYGNVFREFLSLGASLSREQIAEAQAIRDEVSTSWNKLLADLDAFACPAGLPVEVTADQYAGLGEVAGMLRSGVFEEFMAPASFAGLPCLTVPCSPAKDTPPYGLQLVGPRNADDTLCRIGRVFQQHTTWHTQRPDQNLPG